MKIDQSFRYIDNTYEKWLLKRLDYHNRAVEAVEEIKKEKYFELMDWEFVPRTNTWKRDEIESITKRFIMSDRELANLKLSIKTKSWKNDDMTEFWLDEEWIKETIENNFIHE